MDKNLKVCSECCCFSDEIKENQRCCPDENFISVKKLVKKLWKDNYKMSLKLRSLRKLNKTNEVK